MFSFHCFIINWNYVFRSRFFVQFHPHFISCVSVRVRVLCVLYYFFFLIVFVLSIRDLDGWCALIYACRDLCVWVWKRIQKSAHTHTHTILHRANDTNSEEDAFLTSKLFLVVHAVPIQHKLLFLRYASSSIVSPHIFLSYLHSVPLKIHCFLVKLINCAFFFFSSEF